MRVRPSSNTAAFTLPTPDDLLTARLFFLASAVLGGFALPQLLEQGKFSGRVVGTYSAQWLALLAFTFALAFMVLIVATAVWTQGGQRKLGGWAARLRHAVERRAWLGWAVFFAAWLAYAFVVLYRYQKHFADFLPQVWLFFLSVGVGALFLPGVLKRTPFFLSLLCTALVYGLGVKALGFLPEISSMPFSLTWSEGSRFYYASLPYAQALYGVDIPLPSLHPTRYLLQGMAFWAADAEIALHRFWQVALWISTSLLTGLVLARRFAAGRLALLLAGAAWGALFLLQGPVYYHLLVCAIVVLWGFDAARFWKTLLVVFVASLWAGLSRVNWLPVPAMLAVALYFVERPVGAGRPVGLQAMWLYLRAPAIWSVVGLAAALFSQEMYVLFSGHEDSSQFGTSFTSALLWYRLLPNPTYPMGVLLAVLLVSLPILTLLAMNWLRGRTHWHPLRILGILVMLAILFAGGLVVSVKIGGGSNLHNMDAFLTLLMVVGAAVAMGSFASETGGWPRVWRPWPLLLALALLPVVWNLNIGDPFVRRDLAQAEYDLAKLNEVVQEYSAKGDVLFITQRQLQVFGKIPGVPISPDYELMTLTEMSISDSPAYFEKFEQDLQNGRYALIVASRQNIVWKKPAVDSFAEENNAWVEKVALPLLKYYQEVKFFDTQSIQLLAPKD
jgi:hypothetical protein